MEKTKMNYDFLIVGAGLTGAICAYELSKKNYSVLVIDKRNHIGGNCYTERRLNNIDVHLYGAHIFYTDDKEIWDYINQFDNFLPFNRLSISLSHLLQLKTESRAK